MFCIEGKNLFVFKNLLTKNNSARIFIFSLLMLSLIGLQEIPVFYPLWGLDFHNLFVFHKCGGNNPYIVSGQVCGDILGRDMFYPPLLFWLFIWTRYFENYLYASLLWSLVVVILTIISLSYWYCVSNKKRFSNIFILLALLVQFPLVFSIERGNSDVIVLLACTLSAYLFRKNQLFICGLLLGTSILIKIYPVFIAIIFLACSIRSLSYKPLISGIVAALTVIWVAIFSQNWFYFFGVLPKFMNFSFRPSLFSHSLTSIVGPLYAKCMFLLLLLVWVLAAFRSKENNDTVMFAGALAVSTYLSAISFDYNHLTVYPLLFMLFMKAAETPCISMIREAFFAWFVFLGFRVLPAEMNMATLGPIMQWGWLCWFGYLPAVRWRIDPQSIST